MNRAVRPLHALAIGLLGSLAMACVGCEEEAEPDPRFGEETPDHAAGLVVEMKDFDWSTTHGQIVFIEFWATWCGWCIRSMPDLQCEWETHCHDRDFRLMAVNVGGHDDSPDYVRRWRLANSEFTFPMYFDNDDQLSAKYRVTGIPLAVLLDREGQVVYRGHPLSLPEGLLDSLLATDSQDRP